MAKNPAKGMNFGAHQDPKKARNLTERLYKAEKKAARLRGEVKKLPLKQYCGLPLCSPGDCEHI